MLQSVRSRSKNIWQMRSVLLSAQMINHIGLGHCKGCLEKALYCDKRNGFKYLATMQLAQCDIARECAIIELQAQNQPNAHRKNWLEISAFRSHDQEGAQNLSWPKLRLYTFLYVIHSKYLNQDFKNQRRYFVAKLVNLLLGNFRYLDFLLSCLRRHSKV